ncbi:NAD(P)-dependent oxidoreductase [Streptomyces alkaliterrae]|uniref:NAD(P)-dependent oxidoreductase n=1 Tax=Streptomyces alkaliterrae TaxID=2213162 RepID=UPI002B21514C|nr:NAD(P)-binding domain-containing protein [Streptomyces alkaliterrae]
MAVLGLGRMGTPIATAFLDAGYRTIVWNRSPDKVEALAARGAVPMATAAEAVTAAPLVVTPLLDHAAVRQALGTATAALRGRTVVNLANTTPDQARDLAAWTARYGAAYLDGAMMALPETVATASGFFLYSGTEEAFTRFRGALEVMAPAHYFGTDPGRAEIHDLALLGTGYGALAGFLHSLALLHGTGTGPEEFAALAARWLNGLTAYLPELAREVGAARYADGVSTVDLNRAAVDGIVELGRASGVTAAVHEPLRDLLRQRSAGGRGADSFSSVFELMRPRDAPLL